MAYAIIKRCGRVLWFTLFEIQFGAFVFFQIIGLVNSGWLHSLLQLVAIILVFFLYFFIVSTLSGILLVEATRNDEYILRRCYNHRFVIITNGWIQIRSRGTHGATNLYNNRYPPHFCDNLELGILDRSCEGFQVHPDHIQELYGHNIYNINI